MPRSLTPAQFRVLHRLLTMPGSTIHTDTRYNGWGKAPTFISYIPTDRCPTCKRPGTNISVDWRVVFALEKMKALAPCKLHMGARYSTKHLSLSPSQGRSSAPRLCVWTRWIVNGLRCRPFTVALEIGTHLRHLLRNGSTQTCGTAIRNGGNSYDTETSEGRRDVAPHPRCFRVYFLS